MTKSIWLSLLLLVASADDYVADITPDPADDWLAAQDNDYVSNLSPVVAKILKTDQEKPTGPSLSSDLGVFTVLFFSSTQGEIPYLFGSNRLYSLMSLQR